MDRSVEQALRDAAQGLSYRSETLESFEAFTWPNQGDLTPECLRALGGHPADARVRPTTLVSFFEVMTTGKDWHRAAEKDEVRRFRALLQLLQERLQDPIVFRVGEVEVTIHIVGRTPDGNWAGLTTWAVET